MLGFKTYQQFYSLKAIFLLQLPQFLGLMGGLTTLQVLPLLLCVGEEKHSRGKHSLIME